MSLSGKAALVTGGDSGIGHAISIALGRAGAAITVNYHKNEAAADATVREIEKAGGRAQALQGDVSNVADVQRLVDETVQGLRSPRRAGQQRRHGDAHLGARHHRAPVRPGASRIDLKSAFFGVQCAARQMIAQGGGGRIINISSIHEDWPMPGNAAYCCAKGGIRMLTRTAGVELAPNTASWWSGSRRGAVNTPIDAATFADPAR